MQKTVELTEAQYRAYMLDSSSSLKDFSMDRKKYRKKHILRERVEEKENLAANMGRVVETLLLEPDEFDNRFFMSSTVKAPTGLMLDFVEALYKVSKDATDEDGVIQEEFSVLVEAAHKISGFKITCEAVMKKFIDSDAQIYYEEIRAIRPKNLTVITSQEISNANKIVEELKSNNVTARIVNLVDSDRFTVLNQYQVFGFDVDGTPFKGMLDKVIIDNKLKLISPFDLKCVWSVENFFEDYYLFRRAYIQAYLYYKAMVHLTLDPESPYFEYKVNYLKFMICDSINYYNPLIFTLSDSDMQEAYEGFDHKGRTYPGVKNLVKDLKWCKENDIWGISRSNYEKKGIINIKEGCQ
jgi:hypothetical protein